MAPGRLHPRSRLAARLGREAEAARPGIASVGIGIPGLYDPAGGTVRFLVNLPGPWAGFPVAAPVGAALGVPAITPPNNAGRSTRSPCPSCASTICRRANTPFTSARSARTAAG